MMTNLTSGALGSPRRSCWLQALRRYLGATLVGNVIWETLHLPLYTIWSSGTVWQQVFAVVHCSMGDFVIALSALILALVIVGDEGWPRNSARVVLGLTLLFGIGYTIFSEWLNVVVRASWAYSEWMPVISAAGVEIGLSPLLQWVVVPTASFLIVRRATADLSA